MRIERALHEHLRVVLEFLKKPDRSRSFDRVERRLEPLLFSLRLFFLALFLPGR